MTMGDAFVAPLILAVVSRNAAEETPVMTVGI
jgi:hypothetical protein